MPEKQFTELFQGDGTPLADRGLSVPEYQPFAGREHPRKYIASEGLRHAVNVALYLGQPLLITGEPGTGKTRLAAAIAWELGLPLVEFHTKTTSTAADLFYHYDAILRFQDAHGGGAQKPVESYITCRALGLAILLTHPTDTARKILPAAYQTTEPTRSVALIDEIDKAPRDLPNDVLNEIEDMRFRIKETDWPPFEADPKYRPILILTSNSEKNLPDAFVRRCVFYHIPFPDRTALKDIIVQRFSDVPEFDPAMSGDFIDSALDHFDKIRSLNLKKPPATAECIAWLSILKALDLDLGALTDDRRAEIERSYSVLAKNRADLERLKQFLSDEIKPA